MRRANTGTQLDNQVGWLRPEMAHHRFDRLRDNPKLCPRFPGMDQTDHLAYWINDENGAAIGHVDPQTYGRPIRDQAVAEIEGLILSRVFYNTNSISMHLLRSNERYPLKPIPDENIPVNAIKTRQGFHFVA